MKEYKINYDSKDKGDSTGNTSDKAEIEALFKSMLHYPELFTNLKIMVREVEPWQELDV